MGGTGMAAFITLCWAKFNLDAPQSATRGTGAILHAMSRWIVIDNTNPSIVYNGSWTPYQGSQFDDMGFLGKPFNSTLQGTTSNSSISFTFRGTAVVLYGTQQYNGSDFSTPVTNPSWDCVIDNISGPIVDQQPSPFKANNIELCSVSGLEDGEHTITANAHIIDQRTTWFDYVRFLPPHSVPLDNATLYIHGADPQLQYDSDWSNYNDQTNITSVTGSKLKFDFIGNAITWYAAYLNADPYVHASASYAIDKGTPTNISIDRPEGGNYGGLLTNSLLFEVNSLSQGSHTLEVVYTYDSVQPGEALSLEYLLVQNGTGVGPFDSTTPSNTPSQAPSNPSASPAKSHIAIGAVVGAVMGGIAVMTTLLLVYLWSRRRQQNESKRKLDPEVRDQLDDPSIVVEPYTLTSSPGNAPSFKQTPQDTTLTTSAMPTTVPAILASQPLLAPTQNELEKHIVSVPLPGSSRAGVITLRDEDSGLRIPRSNQTETEIVVLPPEYTRD